MHFPLLRFSGVAAVTLILSAGNCNWSEEPKACRSPAGNCNPASGSATTAKRFGPWEGSNGKDSWRTVPLDSGSATSVCATAGRDPWKSEGNCVLSLACESTRAVNTELHMESLDFQYCTPFRRSFRSIAAPRFTCRNPVCRDAEVEPSISLQNLQKSSSVGFVGAIAARSGCKRLTSIRVLSP
jgi:hypothetical protein